MYLLYVIVINMYIAFIIILHPLSHNLISLLVLTSCFNRLWYYSHPRALGCNLTGVNLSKPHTSERCVRQILGEMMLFKKCHIIALSSLQTMKSNEFLFKIRCNALDSPNCFVTSTISQRFYSEDYWFSKYGLYSQSCH